MRVACTKLPISDGNRSWGDARGRSTSSARPIRRSMHRGFSGALIYAMCLSAIPAISDADGVRDAPRYRTIVIVGDTQQMIGSEWPERWPDFVEIVNWIIANKEKENIDFVLHAGDVVESGLESMEMDRVGCDAPTKPLDHRSCEDSEGCAKKGCFESRHRCRSCSQTLRETREEWERFAKQWKRLEPFPDCEGDANSKTPGCDPSWKGLPYGIVAGNHDNPGGVADSDRRGYLDHYGAAHYREVQKRFEGSDRGFEYLETYRPLEPSSNPRDRVGAHAWKFRLGDRPVLVVGSSYRHQRPMLNWIGGVLSKHPETPAVLLSHAGLVPWAEGPFRLMGTLWKQVVENPRFSPQIFLTVQGHVGRDMKVVREVNGRPILATMCDWSKRPGSNCGSSPECVERRGWGASIGILRFELEDEEGDFVSAHTYTPVPRLENGSFRVGSVGEPDSRVERTRLRVRGAD
jgi:hypothetical protein